MKNNSKLKNLLGLTQEEMGAILGVATSQWGMYKSGQRDLPLPAKEKLTSILSHLQNKKETSKEEQAFSTQEQRKVQEWLEKEQRNLTYQKQLLERKRHTIEHKRAEGFAALEVVRFLESQPSGAPAIVLEDIKAKANLILDKYSLLQLEQLQMKEEHLSLVQNTLEQKIKRNKTTS